MKRILVLIGVVVVISVAAGGGLLWWIFDYSCHQPSWREAKYNRQAWSQASEAERYKFVGDILAPRRFVGAPSADVFKELGEPTYVSTTHRYATYVVRIYSDGRCGFNAYGLLRLDFDGTGKITGQDIRFD